MIIEGAGCALKNVPSSILTEQMSAALYQEPSLSHPHHRLDARMANLSREEH